MSMLINYENGNMLKEGGNMMKDSGNMLIPTDEVPEITTAIQLVKINYEEDTGASFQQAPNNDRLSVINNLQTNTPMTIHNFGLIADTSTILLANVPLQDRTFSASISGFSDGRLTSTSAWISQNPATSGGIYALDLGTEKYIAGIRTAGRADGTRQWTTAVDIRTSNTYSLADGHGDLQLDNTPTNYDALTEVDNTFPPVLARYVFIKVRSFGDQTFQYPFPALRCDVLLYGTTDPTNTSTYSIDSKTALSLNYSGLSQNIGLPSTIYDTITFGITTLAVFSRNNTELNNPWFKITGHSSYFSIIRYSTTNYITLIFRGSVYSSDILIPFPFSTLTNSANHLVWGSVKQTATEEYQLHCELWSFTTTGSATLVDSQTATITVAYDDTHSSFSETDYLVAMDDISANPIDITDYGSITVAETRHYKGNFKTSDKDQLIENIISYWEMRISTWILVVRDYKNSTEFITSPTLYTQPGGDFGDENDLTNAYSKLNSLYTNTNEFAVLTTEYEFMWIPYITSGITEQNRKNPETTDTFIHWKQDLNPLLTDDPALPAFNFQFISSSNEGGITTGIGSGQFQGLSLSGNPTSCLLDANGKYTNFFVCCGTAISYGTYGIPWFNNGSITASELFVKVYI